MADTEPPRYDDEIVLRAVLLHVLDNHPAQITTAELTREIASTRPGFAERDQLQRAIRDLQHYGLIQINNGAVSPTRAAQHFARLAGSA